MQNNRRLPTQPLTLPLQKKWIQRILLRQGDNKTPFIISRSRLSAVSTVFLVVASLLPYTDIFISSFVDTSVKMQRFPNLSTAIWSYATCITPLLVLAASQFKPYWFAYIVPCYVYITMLCGFLFLDLNVYIKSDWLFRGITLTLSIIVLLMAQYFIKICKVIRYKEDVMDEMIKFRR